MNRFVQKLSCASLLLGLGGCAGEVASGGDDEGAVGVAAENLVLAEALIAGGTARFLAIDAETVLVETDTVGVENPLHDPALRGLTIVEAYEYWTGEAAPAELVARARQLILSVPGSEAEPPAGEAAGGVAPTASALSATEFAAFCHEAVTYCWLDRTGTWEREHNTRYFFSTTDAVRGDITVSLRRWEVFGGWKQVWKRPIPQGHLLSASGASEAVFGRPLKFKIFDADGDHWHTTANWVE